jgi:hypothetical protein
MQNYFWFGSGGKNQPAGKKICQKLFLDLLEVVQ